MYDTDYEELTQKDIDLLDAELERELAEAEADEAELRASAPSPDDFEAAMNEYFDSIEAEEAELRASAPSPDDFEAMMDEYFASVDDEPEPISDEEIEQILSSREYYREQIQYVTQTHTTKDEAVLNKKKADGTNRSSDDDPLFAIHDVTFDELVNLHEKGMGFRRLPLECDLSRPGRRIIVIDIDNGRPEDKWHPDIAPDDLDSMLSAIKEVRLGSKHFTIIAFRRTKSTSGKQYKYHIFILVNKPIYSAEEYTRIHEEIEAMLNAQFKRLRNIPETEVIPRLTDPKCKSINWFFFGVCQDESRKFLLSHHEFTPNLIPYEVLDEEHLEITDKRRHKERPKPYVKQLPYSLEDWKARTVPTSTSGLVEFLQKQGISDSTTIEVEYAFRATLPYNMKKGGSKKVQCVQEGNRWNSVNIFAIKFYSVWRSCNLYLSTHGYDVFTKNDLINSFTQYVNKAFESTWDYDLNKALASIHHLYQKFEDATDREYCDKYKRYACKKGRIVRNLIEDERPLQTLLRCKNHCQIVTKTIVEQFGLDSKVTFPSRTTMLEILSERLISESAFRKHLMLLGYTLTFNTKVKAGRPTGSNKSSTEDIVMTKGTVVDGVFRYRGCLTSAERQFLFRKGLKVKKDNV